MNVIRGRFGRASHLIFHHHHLRAGVREICSAQLSGWMRCCHTVMFAQRTYMSLVERKLLLTKAVL